MKYSTSLQITARSAWETWYEHSDRACQDTAKVWRWYCQAFFSPEAEARYNAIGTVIGQWCVFAIGLGQIARLVLDGYVESCLEPTSEPASEPTPAHTPIYTEWGIRELRRECSRLSIPRASRLNKAQALMALGDAWG